jgi:hypothetical protein
LGAESENEDPASLKSADAMTFNACTYRLELIQKISRNPRERTRISEGFTRSREAREEAD